MAAFFQNFVIKIASRCNLNCSYCYVYNNFDTGWKLQPNFIDINTYKVFCYRISEHIRGYQHANINVILHGGEPLLIDEKTLTHLLEITNNALNPKIVNLTVTIQSNGLLFSRSIGDILRKYKVRLGISVDGPPLYNDMYRVKHNGLGSSYVLEEKLNILHSDYCDVFNGFLSVVNIDANPKEVAKYLFSFEPKNIDFLLPHFNYNNLPKRSHRDHTPYGDWLIEIFDYWFETGNETTSIRYFESIIRLLLGRNSLVETIGNPVISSIIIQTNGEIELEDTLRSCYDGATHLGYNIFEHSFEEVLNDQKIINLQNNHNHINLNIKCQSCKIVDICGGGHLPHRYSTLNNFDNPSVYCSDITKLILHIKQAITK